MNYNVPPSGDRVMDARARERTAWLAVLYAETSLARTALNDKRKRRERQRRLERIRSAWFRELKQLDAVLS